MKGKFHAFLITWGLLLLYYGGGQIHSAIVVNPFVGETTPWGDAIGYTLVAAFYSGIVLVLFGIPVSVLSDWITKNLFVRPFWAFFVHAGFAFGLSYSLDSGRNTVGDVFFTLMGITFWMADEFIKWRNRRKVRKSKVA